MQIRPQLNLFLWKEQQIGLDKSYAIDPSTLLAHILSNINIVHHVVFYQMKDEMALSNEDYGVWVNWITEWQGSCFSNN